VRFLYCRQLKASSYQLSIGIGTGIELENFQFMLGYDLPLTNSVVNIDPSPSVLKQHNFRFSIAYTIRRSKDKTIVR